MRLLPKRPASDFLVGKSLAIAIGFALFLGLLPVSAIQISGVQAAAATPSPTPAAPSAGPTAAPTPKPAATSTDPPSATPEPSPSKSADRRLARKLRPWETTRASRSLPHRYGSPAYARWVARAWISHKWGWSRYQARCLNKMWERESNWRYWVSNPNGRYHGIPQTSVIEMRHDHVTFNKYRKSPVVQIKVGSRYIKGRYHTPCRAWKFWRIHHWY
jgi:hypothetical protein